MPREVRIRLTFEGTGAGLDNNRLSIDAFAPAFIELQRAFRRIAQGFVKAARDMGSEYVEAAQGKFSKQVAELALEIDRISHNSPPYVELVCSVPEVVVGTTWPMPFTDETVDRTADELLSALESEAAGKMRHANVRAYLAALPPGLTRQSVSITKLSGMSRTVSIGPYERTELNREFPFFIMQTADVAGVSFAPLPPEVRFSGESGPTHAFTDESLVEEALQNRSQPMTGLFVRRGRRTQALWLVPGITAPDPPSNLSLDRYFSKRWEATLRLLAQ